MSVKRFLKSILMAGTLSLAIVMGAKPVHAAPWVFTVTGAVDNGFSWTGDFFDESARSYFSGQQYRLAFTLDPRAYESLDGSAEAVMNGGAQTASVDISVTLGAIVHSYSLDLAQANWGQSRIVRLRTLYSDMFDLVAQAQEGRTQDGTFVQASSSVTSWVNSLNLDIAFDQSWSYSPQAGDDQSAIFLATTSEGGISFYDFNPTSFSLNMSPAADGPNRDVLAGNVPEPGTLVLAGLALASLALRRRSRTCR